MMLHLAVPDVSDRAINVGRTATGVSAVVLQAAAVQAHCASEGLCSRLGASSICMDQVSKRLQPGSASMHGQTMCSSTATLGPLPPERR
jgi:hypothetical protein